MLVTGHMISFNQGGQWPVTERHICPSLSDPRRSPLGCGLWGARQVLERPTEGAVGIGRGSPQKAGLSASLLPWTWMITVVSYRPSPFFYVPYQITSLFILEWHCLKYNVSHKLKFFSSYIKNSEVGF